MVYGNSHFYLLFKKNLTLLKRRPVTLILEFLFPLLIFLLFFGISHSFTTSKHCFSTFSQKSNIVPLPSDVKIAVAPSNQLTRNIIYKILEQNVTILTYYNFEFLKDDKHVNTILDSSPNTYTAALLFDDLELGQAKYPENVTYTIRYPVTISSVREVDWSGNDPGPYSWKCESGVGFCLGHKIMTKNTKFQVGQFQLQQAIDRAIISLKTGVSLVDLPITNIRQLPFPGWIENWFLQGLSESLPMMIIIGFFWNVFISTKDIVTDRDNGVREIFKSFGVSSSSIIASWYAVRFLVAVSVSTFLCFALWACQLIRFSNMFLVWVILVLFSVSIVNLAFLLGTFTSSTTLGMFGILIAYTVSFTPFLAIAQGIDQYSDTTKWIVSLLSPSACSFALNNIGLWESKGIGLTWLSLRDCVGPSGFNAFHSIIMLLLDSVIYAVLFVYFDGLFPGKHGIGLKWNYIFDKDFWREEESGGDDIVLENAFDKMSTLERRTGVHLRGVEKLYYARGRMVQAVNGLTVHFRHNEISTLVGYNGSGKTTTLKMLAAMHKPSKGEIFINGLNLSSRMRSIRKTLGYCPQYNVLINDLSVREHLELFISLKGLTNKSWKREIDMSIQKLKFEGQQDTVVQHLSGGMKRKLSLGLALCGHPKVVILDEPTCSMDTEARKTTWDILLDHRHDRTIIVSTHDMEEADLLSDRCFVMSDGQIIASGSSVDIKAHNGLGYQLTLSVNPEKSEYTDILPLLQQFTPEIRMIRKNYKEQVYAVAEENKANLISLLNFIENEGASYGIFGHGLMQSDLEEALVNVVQRQTSRYGELDYTKLGCIGQLKYYLYGRDDDADTIISNTTRKSGTLERKRYPNSGLSQLSERYSGLQLGLYRLQTLIYKRALDTRRHSLGIVLKLVIPFLLVLFSLIFLKANQMSNLRKYTLNVGGLSNTRPDTVIAADLANTGYFNPNNTGFAGHSNVRYLDWTAGIRRSVNTDYLAADCCNYRFLQLQSTCASTSWNDTMWSNCTTNKRFGYKHCFGDCFQRDVLLNYQGCAPLRRPGDNDTTDIDYFQNQFLQNSSDYAFQKYHHQALSSHLENGQLQLTTWFSTFRYHSIPISLNLINNMLLGYYSNETAGTITTSYWPYQTLSDNLTQAAQVSLPLIIFAIFTTFSATFVAASFSLFLVQERVSKMKHLQLMTGISGRIYWYSNLIWDFITYAIFTISVILLIAMFGISEYGGEYGGVLVLLLLSFGFAALPISYLLTKLVSSAVICFAAICTAGFTLCLSGIMISLYIDNEHVNSLLALIPHAGLAVGVIDLYINKNIDNYNKVCADGETCDRARNPLSMTSPGVGMQVLFMLIEGFVLTVVLISIEELLPVLQLYFWRKDVRKFVQEDSDVAKERRYIREYDNNRYPIIINSISKTLSDSLVVNNVSFGMERKQCVGLLGHNGAGKSTLFSILSGEVIPTYGSVSLFGANMVSDLRHYRQSVGYCPQDAATFPNLTGREVLMMFSGLRGLRREKTEEIVSKLLLWTGLNRYADRLSGNYSGGTLRKLSLAIALIGDPPVLLLDEPNASVDPSSRRMLWKLLRQLADSGKSILISTHVKGEVEAVCDKIVVLSKGHVIAVGPCLEVREKFGPGFCLQVSTKDPTEVDLTKAALEKRLKNVTFVNRVGRHLRYFVPKSTFTYSDIFISIELLKHLVNLDHYAVSQLTFDQLDFVNKFKDNNMDNLDSFLRRIHGYVRKSIRKSLNKKSREPPPEKIKGTSADLPPEGGNFSELYSEKDLKKMRKNRKCPESDLNQAESYSWLNFIQDEQDMYEDCKHYSNISDPSSYNQCYHKPYQKYMASTV